MQGSPFTTRLDGDNNKALRNTHVSTCLLLVGFVETHNECFVAKEIGLLFLCFVTRSLIKQLANVLELTGVLDMVINVFSQDLLMVRFPSVCTVIYLNYILIYLILVEE